MAVRRAPAWRPMEKRRIHFDGWNYLFFDGHVKWLRPEATYRTPGVNYSLPNSAGYYATPELRCVPVDCGRFNQRIEIA